MTNYIEEMMKTAVVEKVLKHHKCDICPYLKCGRFYCESLQYPDFTPKKQLEIIKLIIETQGFCGFANFLDNDKWSISCGINFPVGPNPIMGINFNPTFRKCETFEQAIAQLTTELMKASVLNKKKVKEILEN